MKKERVAFGLLMIVVSVVGGNAHAQDVTEPVVTAASVWPDTIDTTFSGQTVILTVSATDDLSGIDVAGSDTRAILSGGVQCRFSLVSGTPLDAVLEANCFIPQFAVAGDWAVTTLIEDGAGNIARNSFPGLLTVTGTQDVTAPSVTSASVSPVAVDTSLSSQTVTLRVSATDDISGVDVPANDTRAVLSSPSGQIVQCRFFLASGTPQDAVLEASCTIPQFAEAGSWNIATLIKDRVGNIARDSFPGLLTVSGAQDITPPSVSNAVVVPDMVDVSASGQFVILTVNATDDISGIDTAASDTRAVLYSPSGQVVHCRFVLASGSPLEGSLEGSCFVPQFAETGNWTVLTLIEDSAGNLARDVFSDLLTVTLCPGTPGTASQLNFTGDLLVPVDDSGLASVVLEAQLLDGAGDPIPDQAVVFSMEGTGGTFTPDCPGTTDPEGYAECTLLDIPPDLYTVASEFLGVPVCYGGSSDESYLAVFDPSQPRATGGGFFYPDSESSSPAETTSDKANFGFVVYINQQDSADGRLEFQYQAAGINLRSQQMDWYTLSANKAMFQGIGTINGAGLYTFRVHARDGDLMGQKDHFDIAIWLGTDIEADPIHRAKNELAGGNIAVHKN